MSYLAQLEKLQRLFVKGAHEIHVAGDRVDAPNGTEGHFFPPQIFNIVELMV
jgi:hypothetical protein